MSNPMKRPLPPGPVVIDDIYVPFAEPTQDEPSLLGPPSPPNFLTTPEEEVLEPEPGINYEEVQRLDFPEVIAGYRLRPDIKQLLESFSTSGRQVEKCYRCKNTGVCQWRNAGATAKVCRCVREGAAVQGFADAVEAEAT
jgi:hypothetical protein